MTFQLTPGERFADLDSQVRSAIEAAGLEPPSQIYADGRLHRFRSGTKANDRDKTGWYVIFPDGVPAGRFGCWRNGAEHPFRANTDQRLTAAEESAMLLRTNEIRAMREAAQEQARNATAGIVSEIWEHAEPADPEHPYLKRKGIQPHGARVTGDGRLIVPLYAPSGELSSLQYIDDAGHKLYHLSGATGGCYHTVGRLDGAKCVYLAEGFATAATIHEATGQPVAVSYSASNLVPVCGELVKLALPVVIVADNDKGGVGQRYAEQAAAKFGARYVMPPEHGDANDFALGGGDLLALLEPQVSGWLVPASAFLDQPAPLKWLIRKWIPQNCFAMAYGPSGGGKTFVVLDWCLRIASEFGDWCAQKVNAGSVVYLAGEGHHGLRARVAAWCSHHGRQPGKLWVSSSGCDLDTPEGYLKARDAILETGEKPCLIVVDTLHRFLSGDENSAQDARRMIAACGGLMREFGSTVLLVHHTGASEEAQHRARGSSAWRGSLDVEIAITPGDDGQIGISQRKMKDAEQAADVSGSLVPHAIPGWVDDDGEQVGSVVFCAVAAPLAGPVKVKADSEVTRAWKTFVRAWHASGWEFDGSDPFVSRSAMMNLLRSDGLSDTQARIQIRADKKGAIGTLINGEILRTNETGWVVCNPSYSAQLALQGKDEIQRRRSV